MSDTEHTLRREAEAARDLLAALNASGEGDDGDLVHDVIEGETGLLEAISAALSEIDETEVMIFGGKAKIEQFERRVAMAEHRVERIRAAIERAMVMLDQPTVKLPTATLTVSKRKPGLVVSDESAIPSRFWTVPEPPPPKLDKRALAAALAAGETVAGAGLDNGTISLTIRRK